MKKSSLFSWVGLPAIVAVRTETYGDLLKANTALKEENERLKAEIEKMRAAKGNAGET